MFIACQNPIEFKASPELNWMRIQFRIKLHYECIQSMSSACY